MSDSQLAMHSRTFSFIWNRPEVFIDVNAFDHLVVGISNIASMLAVFPAETQAVVSSRAKFGRS
eukprot:10728167-Ditylum_brightwellii.AAC.1